MFALLVSVLVDDCFIWAVYLLFWVWLVFYGCVVCLLFLVWVFVRFCLLFTLLVLVFGFCLFAGLFDD